MTKNFLKEKDLLIIRELLTDGRKSASKISKDIDLGREIVNYRIKRLIKENLIIKFVPRINKSLSYSEYLIFLKLNLKDEVSKEKFIKEKIGNRYLLWFIKHSTGWDVIVRIFVRDIQDFKEKLNEILMLFNKYLTNYYTLITSENIKETEREAVLERLFNEKVKYETIKKIEDPKEILDEKDMRLIEKLREDARVKYTEIAKDLELTPDAIKYRIDRLLKNKILLGFYPIINFGKIGYEQYAYILKAINLSVEKEKKTCNFLKKSRAVIKAVKGLNCFEYFFLTIFKDKNEKNEFEKELKYLLKDNIEILEGYPIE